MPVQESLSLYAVDLKSGGSWRQTEDGLYFVLPKHGCGKAVVGSATYPLLPGDVLVFDGSSASKVEIQSAQEFSFWWFRLRIEQLLPLLNVEEICLVDSVNEILKKGKVYPAGSAPALQSHQLVRETPSQFDLSHRAQLLRIAIVIEASEFEPARLQRAELSRAEQSLAKGLAKLSVADIASFSVAELAKRFGYSQRHLNRLFHQYLGYSASALRMEMRLLKAAALLKDPGAKILHVAEQCGFNHTGLFNTCFKRRFGRSPGQYRDGLASQKNSSLERPESRCDLRLERLCSWAHKESTATPLHDCPQLIAEYSSEPNFEKSENGLASLRNGQASKSWTMDCEL